MQLRLVPLAEEHLAEVGAALDDPDVARFTRLPSPAPDGFLGPWLERYRQPNRKAFAAVDEQDRFLGVALAPEINAEAGEMELGYLVPRTLRNRGIATELLRQLTDWALSTGAFRLTLLIDRANVASQKVAERAGYQLEGTMRATYVKPGVRTDIQLWSRLASDR